MGRFDKDTTDFMEKLASDHAEEPAKTDLSKLRTLKSVVKSIQDPHKAIGKALVSGLTMKAVFEKEASASVLGVFGLLNEHYGRAWWNWEPETVWQTLSREHSTEATEDLRSLIAALQLTVTTNQPFENWHIFEKVGQAFNHNPVNFGIVQPLEPQEAALTVKLLQTIRPKAEFDPEIYAYVAATAKNAGLVYTDPKVFFLDCQSFLDRMGNDTDLVEALRDGKNTDDLGVQIQRARLAEVGDYVESHI